jgi:hypothetical protein
MALMASVRALWFVARRLSCDSGVVFNQEDKTPANSRDRWKTRGSMASTHIIRRYSVPSFFFLPPPLKGGMLPVVVDELNSRCGSWIGYSDNIDTRMNLIGVWGVVESCRDWEGWARRIWLPVVNSWCCKRRMVRSRSKGYHVTNLFLWQDDRN